MNLIEELKNYCNIDNPIGALMLTGEWGCGKTYLIKNKFIPSEKDTYAFVNVSLFGIDSLDKLRAEVKKKWLEKASEIDKQNGTNVSKFADSYKKIFGIIKDILPEDLQKTGNAFSSIMDLVNFMPISNRMFEKKVVLVFDDLERTNIPCTDLLGCINDYCENQNFNTIIVANEEKIKDSSNNELSYREIKEKIVQRIIPFVPDYEEVVSNCIESVSLSREYKGFLRKNKELLVKILSGDFNDNEIIEQYKIEQYKLDDKIDWEKVREGIRQQIKYLVKSDEKDNHFHRMIEDNSEEYFTEDEWSAYQIIKEFRDNDVWIYEKDQRLYIDLISSDLIRAFRDLSNKRYNKFSFEMESATIDAFKNATNANKNHFSGWFVGIWGQYSNSSEIDEQVTMRSLKKLRDDLNFIMQEYKEKNMNISAMHTQNFIKKLDVIIKPENEDSQTGQVTQ